jgi:AraC-like DNA-binding protein
MLRRATSFDDMLSAPTASYVVGVTSLSFVADRHVAGMIVWGRPSAEDIAWLVRTHEKLRPLLPPHGAYVDARLVEAADSSAFAALLEFVSKRGAWLAEGVERLALVRASGPLGAMAEGFFGLISAPLPVSVFADPSAALGWLGHPDAPTLANILDAVTADATGTAPFLRDLRNYLDEQPGKLSLADAARRLALSERSLQRKLASFQTSFQAEHNQAQVRAAKRLLQTTNASLTRVALDVGCASLAHFSSLFRKLEGVSPSEWRATHGKPSED